MENRLSIQQKKELMLKKYAKRDYKIEDIEKCKKWAVYYNPAIDKVEKWVLLAVTNTLEEAKHEIFFRKAYMDTKDADLLIDNMEEFKTWRDETKNVDQNGRTIEPSQELMNLNYNVPGDFMQVISNNSTPAQQNNNSFKGLCHYSTIEIGNYQGFYEIREIYVI